MAAHKAEVCLSFCKHEHEHGHGNSMSDEINLNFLNHISQCVCLCVLLRHPITQPRYEVGSTNLTICVHVFVPQVMQVVREQITRTLSSKPTSLELFKNKVNALNYSEILKLRQTERLHQEETLAPPVL